MSIGNCSPITSLTCHILCLVTASHDLESATAIPLRCYGSCGSCHTNNCWTNNWWGWHCHCLNWLLCMLFPCVAYLLMPSLVVVAICCSCCCSCCCRSCSIAFMCHCLLFVFWVVFLLWHCALFSAEPPPLFLPPTSNHSPKYLIVFCRPAHSTGGRLFFHERLFKAFFCQNICRYLSVIMEPINYLSVRVPPPLSKLTLCASTIWLQLINYVSVVHDPQPLFKFMLCASTIWPIAVS